MEEEEEEKEAGEKQEEREEEEDEEKGTDTDYRSGRVSKGREGDARNDLSCVSAAVAELARARARDWRKDRFRVTIASGNPSAHRLTAPFGPDSFAGKYSLYSRPVYRQLQFYIDFRFPRGAFSFPMKFPPRPFI